MSNQHEHIDLTTLKEVERLLTSTDVTAFNELSQRDSAYQSPDVPAPTTEGFAPLPRRS